MSSPQRGGASPRPNSFNRFSTSPSPGPASLSNRPHSAMFPSTKSASSEADHSRNNSFSLAGTIPALTQSDSRRNRSGSIRSGTPMSGTFEPQFIKSEAMQRSLEKPNHIEGENDFSGKRYVWMKDPDKAFIKGWVVEEQEEGKLLVQCDDNTQRMVDGSLVDRVNPAKFDKANDMAELTYLNEASVVHNLNTRYRADLIYTYSGLFLVTVNPYCPLPIYSKDYINMYRGRPRADTKPHIFAVAEEAFRNLVDAGENQSVLVTGESGAGKTENTKKVIQYLASVATPDSLGSRSGKKNLSNLSQQILRANPILEAFGNAQTLRNNNSSRFGKFIRIQFSRAGQIAGAYIDWYLLEKSRVVRLNPSERSYHIFYQLLRGADRKWKKELMLDDKDVEDFQYLYSGNDAISGVSDVEEWNSLIEAFHIMGFSDSDQRSILRTVAAVLHLGNISVVKESVSGDQATLDANGRDQAAKACKLLGIPLEPFMKALLHPRVKAGREWITKVQTPEQVRLSIDALSKGIYERGFGDLVDRINRQLNRSNNTSDDTHFIGVLDIAGFEIFEDNSFEQLCINYTNEKLQQFFNHHMFVLEQEEYAREQIEWQFVDFGKDLQPTIDLIELTNPIGIFSCLDEDSVMPKATDKTFTEKLHSLWDRKSTKYKRSRLNQGFLLTHYAADVEYSTDGWLEKNKDPLNDNATALLASSSEKHISELFADCANSDEDDFAISRSRVKKGLFRTVAQRHKEQLSGLMAQLRSTHPHFVRCILPNHNKRPKTWNAGLVLDQLRCNGVLEGIRIARTGFPNRIPFGEFRSRYEVLCKSMPKGYLEGQEAARIIVERLEIDPADYRIGLTKVFFRAGVLADLEEQRDALIREIMSGFQSVARGFCQRRAINKKLYRAEAAQIIHQNFKVYLQLQSNPWWRLFVRMRPLLGATRQSAQLKKRDEMINTLEQRMLLEAEEKQNVEDDRRRAENEVLKVQQTLENERALALDKEEIFKRLQERETELSEKLAGALDDQENLEDQIDELMTAKKTAEQKASALQQELENAGGLIGNLEDEKRQIHVQLTDIEAQLTSLHESRSRTTETEKRLGEEVSLLKSESSMKDRKIQDLDSKAAKADQDLSLKLSEASKELRDSQRNVSQLSDEKSTLQQQVTRLSSAVTGSEEKLRLRESEMLILRSDLDQFKSDRARFDEENRKLSSKHDVLQCRVRDAEAEMEALKSQQSSLQREAADARLALQERDDEHAASAKEERESMDMQVSDLKQQLFQAQSELNRERQSRDDVQMLGEHNLSTLKRDYDELNQAKITIEKELYSQQDVLRRTKESKTKADSERKEFQDELKTLRQRYLELQETKLNAENEAEQKLTQLADEREAASRRELMAKEDEFNQIQSERDRLAGEVQKLKQIMADSDSYRAYNDESKERLEREIVTIKGRLTASENDNRTLLNKLQQKELDIASSHSRNGETSRWRITQLQNDRSRQEEENRSLSRQLEESKLTIRSLEQQVEELNDEVSFSEPERNFSALDAQLREANKKLETARQLSEGRNVQSNLDKAHQELADLLSDCHGHLESQLQNLECSRSKEASSVRNVDRTVRDLQSQLERRDRANAQLQDDMGRSRDRMERLMNTIEELQSSEEEKVSAAQKAERELKEEKEGRLRLERELEGWKGLRIERGPGANQRKVSVGKRSGTWRALSELGGPGGSRRGSISVDLGNNAAMAGGGWGGVGGGEGKENEEPMGGGGGAGAGAQGLNRMGSETKGFL